MITILLATLEDNGRKLARTVLRWNGKMYR
jgi:hypothetical protein